MARINKITLTAFLLCAAVYLALAWALPHNAFWTTDCGNKFIVLQNIAARGSANIAYPAADIDPAGDFFPRADFHFLKHNGEMRPFFPVWFPAVSALFYKLFGLAGIYIMPLVCGLGAAALAGLIAAKLRPEAKLAPAAAMLICAFCSPVLFYSLEFWEQTPAVFLAALALWLILRRDTARLALAAGLAAGASLWLREEAYIFCAAVFIALFVLGRAKRAFHFAAGALTAALPLWTLNIIYDGHPLGLHWTRYNEHIGKAAQSGTDIIFHKLGNFFVLLFSFDTPGIGGGRALMFLLAAPFFAALVLGFFRGGTGRVLFVKTAALLLCCVSSAVAAWSFFADENPVFDSLMTQALFLDCPFAAIFLLRWREAFFSRSESVRFLALVCLLSAAGVCLGVNRGDPGIFWGPRFFLFIFPALAALSVRLLSDTGGESAAPGMRKTLSAAGFFLFIVSAFIQAQGVRTLFEKKAVSAGMLGALGALPPDTVVISDVFWLPEEAAALFYRLRFMAPSAAGDVDKIAAALKKAGVKEFTLVLSPHYRTASNEELSRLLDSAVIRRDLRVSPPRAPFLSLVILDCSFRKAKD
jgi:hypothetical protein